MESFIHVAGWSHMQPRPTVDSTNATASHISSTNRSPTPAKSLSNAAVTESIGRSSTHPATTTPLPTTHQDRPHVLAKYPSTSVLPQTPLNRTLNDDEMSTLPDPRSRVMTPSNSSPLASPIHHPDLSEEVATLSTKLINAINHQTYLDDTLSATRHELEAARGRISELEAQNAAQRETLSGDIWVQKSSVEADKRALRLRASEEKAKRLETEKENKRIEQELEGLSTALFEEANKMVVRAKEEAKTEHGALQRKNDQIRAQLADAESLLRSQQEQLAELKHVMESMASERDEQTSATAPSSPRVAKFESKDVGQEYLGPSLPLVEAMAPTYATNLHHLVQPVLRHDLSAYDDFVTLARLARKRTNSRVSSGSTGGIGGLAIVGLGGYGSTATPSSASMTSLPNGIIHSPSSAPHSPSAANANGSPGSVGNQAAPTPSLKDTRFYRRVLAEDIEPTLRLDAAPALSWLARRAVYTAVSEGTLVVEPVANSSPYVHLTKPQFHPCSLCGESRKDAVHLRNHRFRASEADTAQRYPLCGYCLGRVRSTCDFLGFLRVVKDGHWRAEDDDQEKSAWEESVRLREQMFWARIGGGVVPVGHIQSNAEVANSASSQDALEIENQLLQHTLAITDKANIPGGLEKELPPEPVKGNPTDNPAIYGTAPGHMPTPTDPPTLMNLAEDSEQQQAEQAIRHLSVSIPEIKHQ